MFAEFLDIILVCSGVGRQQLHCINFCPCVVVLEQIDLLCRTIHIHVYCSPIVNTNLTCYICVKSILQDLFMDGILNCKVYFVDVKYTECCMI